MYLNEKSVFLVKPVAKKPVLVVEAPKEENKDELLNDFMAEDNTIVVDTEDVQNIEDYEFEDINDEDVEYDSETEALMDELF